LTFGALLITAYGYNYNKSFNRTWKGEIRIRKIGFDEKFREKSRKGPRQDSARFSGKISLNHEDIFVT